MGEFEAAQLIKNRVNDDLAAKQKEFYLRRQLKAIQKELQSSGSRHNNFTLDGPDDDEVDEIAQLEAALEKARLPTAVQDVAMRNLKRLRKMNAASPEHQGLRTYLETLADLPWHLKGSRIEAANDEGPSKDSQKNGLGNVKERSVSKDSLQSKPMESNSSQESRDNGRDEVEAHDTAIEHETKNADSVMPQVVAESALKDLMSVNIETTRKQLDADHYGLERVKRRIIEYVAVRKLKQNLSGPIMCLVGPPGVGKTSLGKSVARSLGREFTRLALGGVHDEAEIRGHRRTYIGAMPGTIIQSIRRVKCRDPVILLDEVDKMGGGFGTRSGGGDPAAALLEVLDPEQNHSFVDHYLNVPFDLSAAVFIATANSFDLIPAPLLDRMEVIHLSGYTALEKVNIASRYLVPRQLVGHGMSDEHLSIPHETIMHIIQVSSDLRYCPLALLLLVTKTIFCIISQGHTREAGVRQLEQRIASICRFIAVSLVEHNMRVGDQIDNSPFSQVVMDVGSTDDILGVVRYEHDSVDQTAGPGVGTGLAWTPTGGELLFIECSLSPGSGKVQLTGQLGDVMKESARLALSWLQANFADIASILDMNKIILARSQISQPQHIGKNDLIPGKQQAIDSHLITLNEKTDLHLHVPAGGTPKDGPSAGVAIVATLFSLFVKWPIDPFTAMTGEITLRGRVLPVGGIREKVLAASRGGIKTIILPRRNERDLTEIPNDIRESLRFVYADVLLDVLQELFPCRISEGAADSSTVPRLDASL